MARTVTITQFNTDANTIPLAPIEWIRSAKGNPPPRELTDPSTGRPFLAAATQYAANGDMVHILQGAVNDVANAATHPIAGFVVGGGSADGGTTAIPTGAEVRIMPVRTGDVYAMNFWAATPLTASNPADIQVLIGACFNIATISTVNWNLQTGALGTDVTNCTAVEWLATTQTAARVMLRGVRQTLGINSANWLCRVEVEFTPVVTTWTLATNLAATIIGPNLQFDA